MVMAMLMAMSLVYGWTKSQEGFGGGAMASFQCPFLFIARCNPPLDFPGSFHLSFREMLGAWDLGGPPSTPPALARARARAHTCVLVRHAHARRDATQPSCTGWHQLTTIAPVGD